MAVQYRVLLESAYDAWYRLSDPRGQIQAYVFDVIRSTVPRMELDEAFASKDEIAAATLTQLEGVMKDYGYQILNTLVTDLSPDARVKASMNEINASKRLKEAASHKAEADKIKQVKDAEADAEAKYLNGLGIARQRKAIVQGLQASVSEFSNQVEGSTPKDVMNILMLSQYFDTLTNVGANNLILEHDPATVANLQAQVGKSFHWVHYIYIHTYLCTNIFQYRVIYVEKSIICITNNSITTKRLVIYNIWFSNSNLLNN